MRLRRLGNNDLVPQQLLDGGNGRRRDFDAVAKNPAYLSDNHLSGDEFVFCENQSDKIRTQAASRKGAHQHIRVEKHPHDTT